MLSKQLRSTTFDDADEDALSLPLMLPQAWVILEQPSPSVSHYRRIDMSEDEVTMVPLIQAHHDCFFSTT